MRKDVYEVPAHQYGFAGLMNSIAGNPDKDGNITSGAFANMKGSVAGGLGALGSAVGGMAGSAIAGGRESTAGNIIGGLGDIASAIPGPWGAVAGAGLKVIGGLTNAAFGVKLNQENINAVNNNIASLNNFQSDASNFDSLAQNFNTQPTAMRFDQSFIGKNGWFNKGATKKYNELLSQQDAAQQFVSNSLNNNMNNLVTQQNQNLLANYAAEGGMLETQGSEWSTGLNYIGAGGSHEQNPNGGIQQGIAPDGLPNLVEEGEVIWNGDYVFSKRLKVPKAVRNKYKLRGAKPMSFADAALEFNKEMDERPNDPISKRGRDGMLAKLADAQEEKRAKIQAKEQAQQAATMDMMGMPQDQMAMEQPMQEDVMSEANQEELARQEIMQGMQQPTIEGYAAKGGPIGHKYVNAGMIGKAIYPTLDNKTKTQIGAFLDALRPFFPDGFPDFENVEYEDIPVTEKQEDVTNTKPAKPIKIKGKPFVDPTLDDNYTLSNDFLAIRPEDRIYNPELDGAFTYPRTYNISAPVVVGARNYNGDLITTSTPSTIKPNILPLISKKKTSTDVGEQSKSDTYVEQSNYPWQGYLRYAPAIGSAIGVFSDLMGWTNKPDYSAAEAIANASRNVRDVSFRPIGDYARYVPADRMMALNQLNAAAGANRRGILNTSAGNRGTAMAGILASDNNYINNIGNTLFSAENANYDRYMKALAHNTDVNKFNSEGFLKASIANQGAGEVRARYAALAADARSKALALSNANRSANLTNLFDNLGNIGIDALNRADARWLAMQWPGGMSQPTLGGRTVKDANGNIIGYVGKKGGRINKRRRRRII